MMTKIKLINISAGMIKRTIPDARVYHQKKLKSPQTCSVLFIFKDFFPPINI